MRPKVSISKTTETIFFKLDILTPFTRFFNVIVFYYRKKFGFRKSSFLKRAQTIFFKDVQKFPFRCLFGCNSNWTVYNRNIPVIPISGFGSESLNKKLFKQFSSNSIYKLFFKFLLEFISHSLWENWWIHYKKFCSIFHQNMVKTLAKCCLHKMVKHSTNICN